MEELFTVDISLINKGYINITYFPSKSFSQNDTYYFVPDNLYSFGKFISDIIITDFNGIKTNYKRDNSDNLILYDVKEIKKIEYVVKDLWTSNKKIYKPASTNISNSRLLLSFHNFIGYFKSKRHNKYIIKIIDNKKKLKSIYIDNKAFSKTDSSYSLRYSNYDDVIKESCLFSNIEPSIIEVDDKLIFVTMANNRKNIKIDTELLSIKPLLNEAFSKYINNIDTVYINILFAATAKDEGICFGKSINLVLPEIFTTRINIEILQDLMAHELLHLITPTQLHDKKIDNNLFFKKNMSSDLWFTEGAVEFLSRQLLLDAKIYDSLDFKNKLGRYLYKNMNNRWDNLAHPITWYSSHVTSNSENIDKSIFYERGALICFYLDQIIRDSNPRMSFKKVVDSLYSLYVDKPYEFTDFIITMKDIVGFNAAKFIDSCVLDTLSMNHFNLFSLSNYNVSNTIVKDSFLYYSFFDIYNKLYYYGDSIAIKNKDGNLLIINAVNNKQIKYNNFFELLDFSGNSQGLTLNYSQDTIPYKKFYKYRNRYVINYTNNTKINKPKEKFRYY
jgi:hypothetical protein